MLSGKLLKVEQNAVWVASPSLREPLRFPAGALRSLVFNVGQRGPFDDAGRCPHRHARLRGGAPVRLPHSRGQKQQASCLAWQPLESATGSPLRPSVSGRIQYRETPAAHPVAPVQPRRVRRQVNIGVNGGAAMVIVEDGNVRHSSA